MYSFTTEDKIKPIEARSLFSLVKTCFNNVTFKVAYIIKNVINIKYKHHWKGYNETECFTWAQKGHL